MKRDCHTISIIIHCRRRRRRCVGVGGRRFVRSAICDDNNVCDDYDRPMQSAQKKMRSQ